MFKTEYALISLVTAALTGALSAFVFRKGIKNKINSLYGFWAMTVSLWSLCLVLSIYAVQIEAALFWCRALHFWAIILPAVYVHFVLLFLNKVAKRKLILGGIYFVSLMTLLANLTDWFIVAEHRTYFDFYVSTPGVMYPTHVVLFVGSIFYVYAELLESWLRTVAVQQRKRILTFLLATIVGYSGGITNYLINYNISIFPLYPYGNLTILLYVVFIGFAIVRYKFLDIEVIIKRTLVFTGVVGVSVFVIALPFGLIQAVIGKVWGVPDPWVLIAIGIITTVLIHRPVEGFLSEVTDRYLFQKRYDYRKLLKEASREMAQIKSLKKLARAVAAFLVVKGRIKTAAVYFYSAAQRGYAMIASRPLGGGAVRGMVFEEGHALLAELRRRQGPVEKEGFKNEMALEGDAGRKELMRECLEVMERLKAEAVVPSFLYREARPGRGEREPELRSVLFLGSKKSDESYTAEDLDVFYTLAQESAIAIENARLYDEAVSRSLELARMNEDLHAVNKRLKETQAALMEEKKRALLAGISSAVGHEIRSPLSSQSTNLYFCEKRLSEIKQVYDVAAPRLEKPQQEALSKSVLSLEDYLQRVVKSADRIKGIVNTLVNLVKQRTEDKTEVQLKLLIASALEEVRFQTYWETLSEPKFDIQIPPDLPFILGITHDLQGVFVNLIINALHAMENKSDKRIAIRASLSDGPAKMIEIYFSDNGCGIPAGNLEKVFEHGFTTKGARGTGIGLFYCKDIIERIHGGSLQLSSEPGAGTTFIIRLPAYDKNVVRQG